MSALIKNAKRHLRKIDPVMARLMATHDPYGRDSAKPRYTPYYHVLVQSVINQQLSVKAAQTIGTRMRVRQGGRHFNAERVLALRVAAMRRCGVSGSKVRYIRTLSRAVVAGELNFRRLVRQDDDIIRGLLTQYPGIGPWSADMFLMFALHRPDVLPLGDLVLRKSMQRHYGLAAGAKDDAYLNIAAAWRPYRSIASRYLWAAAAG